MTRRSETSLRPLGAAMAIGAALLVPALVHRPDADALAQAGTPAPAGVASVPFAVASVAQLPPAPAVVGLLRLTLAPGTRRPIDAADPSIALVAVESGSLTLRVDAPVTLFRGRTQGPAETLPAGRETTLGPGDAFLGPPLVAGEERNDGPVPTILLIAFVAPTGPPAAATPTP